MERNLDPNNFIRSKLYSSDKSNLEKYAELVIGKLKISRLIKYEIITGVLGPLPGAIGLFLRKKIYPSLFPRIGNNVVFGKNITLRNTAKILLGDNVIIDDYAVIDGRGTGDGFLKIGNNCFIGRNVSILSKVGKISIGANCNIGASSTIVAQGGITIENDVIIAGGCTISGGLFKFNPERESGILFDTYTKGCITIKEKSLIGGDTHILDGVTVGRCCFIGTGSVVFKDIPDFSKFSPRPGMIIGKVGSIQGEAK